MSEDTDDSQKSMTRRATLSGAGVVAGGWLVNKLTGGAVSVANAQQSQEYRIAITGDNPTWAIDDESQGDGTTDLIFRHVPSDTTVRWDRSAGEWDFSQVSTFIVDSLTANTVDSQTVNTDEARINEGGARIYATTTQSIDDSTVTTVQFDTEDGDFNPGDVLTADLSNNQISIEKNGRYLIKGRCGYANPDDGQRTLARLNVGGSILDEDNLPAGSAESVSPLSISIVAITSAPTNVSLETFQDNSSDTAKDTDGRERSVHLEVARLG